MNDLKNTISEYSWVGSEKSFVDIIDIMNLNQVSIGRFGGNSHAGQYKNEDGCLIWVDDHRGWEFVVILDAHQTAESAEIVIAQFARRKAEIQALLSLPYKETIDRLEETIVNMFQEDKFLYECQHVKGETACLILFRKDKYVWWLSIGDCISYIFHPELANLGQYQLNQRQFFEWIGQVNTFEQVIPCYSSGVRELRKGTNRMLLTTDGLVECPNKPFSNPKDIYEVMKHQPNNEGIMSLLQTIQENNVRDSTTIISWDVNITVDVSNPSDQ
ncbi:protein phosphatase 2C domain-containing protein [Guptibacillus algicola]|uniref:protein phosphatase 2C domain-containing protein n=1 Tax=Guptibacillus algicola TaxID=225844 RepID=UPI001CD7BD57|nr:protein phosphatase 2C domain-containing protein [Alkalihalobacillus algicola]MCA0987418.1 protein phosphatase 2C domain-containing protein [Alkalihalobacillus algicola]